MGVTNCTRRTEQSIVFNATGTKAPHSDSRLPFWCRIRGKALIGRILPAHNLISSVNIPHNKHSIIYFPKNARHASNIGMKTVVILPHNILI